ncbi:Serine/threonine-protein kinase [Ceratobasidium sp. AG-Ba]|nr:Serine/threonine-protein kinase [Ceratobasidium sp. AG-Ba]QRW08342.1 Serine/threonine-protein kinase [Ceratobasidium sp. AG-Ba]
MTDGFWKGLASDKANDCAERCREALSFILSHGGVTSRWQSVVISTDAFAPHDAMAKFLRDSLLPTLQYLELKFHGPSNSDSMDELMFNIMMSVIPMPLFRETPSSLRVVKLAGFANPFIFGHFNQLQIPGLTHLELDFVGTPPDLSDISSLLRVISKLEVLRFSFGWTDSNPDNKVDPPLSKVELPCLQDLGLFFMKEGYWSQSFLMMLEAPRVEHFQLNMGECEVEARAIMQLFTTPGGKHIPNIIFPSVTRLKVVLDRNSYDSTSILEALLLAHPKTTVLEVSWAPLKALAAKLWLVPDMQHLRVSGCDGSELREAVMARTEVKLPLKLVEAEPFSGYLIKTPDRDYIRSKVQFQFVEFFTVEYRVVDDPPNDDEFSGVLPRMARSRVAQNADDD